MEKIRIFKPDRREDNITKTTKTIKFMCPKENKRMAVIFTMLLLNSFSLTVNAQCTFNTLFPVQLGENQFKTETTLDRLGTAFYERDDLIIRGRVVVSYDATDELDYDYLIKNNKKIIRVMLSYRINSNNCLFGKEPKIHFIFANDKLYLIRMECTFNPNEYDFMIANYNTLKGVLQSRFKVNGTFIKNESRRNKPETSHQVGEGMWYADFYYKNPDLESDNLHECQVSYILEDEIVESYPKLITKKIYKINIEYVNLKGTGLTRLGY